MGQPAAKQGDLIVSPGDIHYVQINTPDGPVVQPMPLEFQGAISQGCCTTVKIGGMPAAVKGAGADNSPAFIHGLEVLEHPLPSPADLPHGASNQGSVTGGTGKVKFGGSPSAQVGTACTTCHNLPEGNQAPSPVIQIAIASTVKVG